MDQKQREQIDLRLYLGSRHTPFDWSSHWNFKALSPQQTDHTAFMIYGQSLQLKRFFPPPTPLNQPFPFLDDPRSPCCAPIISTLISLLKDLPSSEHLWVFSCFAAHLSRCKFRIPLAYWSQLCPYLLSLFPKVIPYFKVLIGPAESQLLERNPYHPLHKLMNQSTYFSPPPLVESSQLDRFNQISTFFSQNSLHSLLEHPQLLLESLGSFESISLFLLNLETLRLHPSYQLHDLHKTSLNSFPSSTPPFSFPLPLIPLSTFRAFHADLNDHLTHLLGTLHTSPNHPSLLEKSKHHTLILKHLKVLLSRLSLSPYYQHHLLEDLDRFNHPFELAQSDVHYLFSAMYLFKFLA